MWRSLLLCSSVTVASSYSLTSRPALPSRPLVAHRSGLATCCAASEPATAPAGDLVGDGGVLKAIKSAGNGAAPPRGSTVEVHYVGTLDDGTVFDSSRARGRTFKFTIGEGKVIGGWEVGLSTMSVGERSTLTCAPQYAYGAKGIPPTIPPSATLQFDVELLAVQLPKATASTFADDNPNAARTPGAIQQEYEQRMAAKEAPLEGLKGALKWAKSIYIFGFFTDEKGEMPPWYLNPLITFPTIFAVVGIGFTLVVELGGLHRGEVAPMGDDLSNFIGIID